MVQKRGGITVVLICEKWSVSKKRQYILTYHGPSKTWKKKYKGKTHYLVYSPSKSDREKYREAVDKWNRIKAEIDAGEYDAEKERLASEKKRLVSVTKSGRQKGRRRYNPRQISNCIKKFLEFKQGEVNSKQITPSRLKSLQYALVPFGDRFGDVQINQISEREIEKFRNEQSKRVARNEIKPSTLDHYFRAIRQFFLWAWKNRLINERPRNLSDLKGKILPRKVDLFTPDEIQALVDGIGQENLDPKWQSRAGPQVDHTILEAAILLGLNCGYTQMDISTLRVGDCQFRKRPPRVVKRRSKSGVPMEHLMWKRTKSFLEKHCNGKKQSDLVFTRSDGKPIVPFSIDKDGNIVGGRSDWMGDKFKRLVQRVLGGDDPRRMRELRKTGADFVKQREVGIEKLYLGHTDSSMSGRYTKPAQKALDGVLCFMEMDFGFTDKLQPYYSKRVRQ